MKFSLAQVPEFYQGYIRQVGDTDLITLLKESGSDVVALCEHLTEPQALYRYAENKWSIKDLIQHLIDSERVFVYRAMRFARNDQTELSGFDQDDYVREVFADKFSMQELVTAFSNVRQTTIDLFTSLSESELLRGGKSNGVEMTVEMIGFIIGGHTRHHQMVIREKYL